jgi:hypothetical protein
MALMPPQRMLIGRAAIAIAGCSTAWVIGVGLFWRSGGFNSAGLAPTLGCVVALWGAIRVDAALMWLGTMVVTVSSALYIFSIGLAVAPAGVALIIASLLLRGIAGYRGGDSVKGVRRPGNSIGK